MAFVDEIHPGCLIALSRLAMDEVGVARAIAAGELVSPQRIGNMWLFAIRITGTGTSFRPQLNEVVFRPPEHYLTDGFLARCNGLPVIIDHPEPDKKNPSGMLNTKEYKDRVIGAIMLPYINGSEVWGIARINHTGAAQLMMEEDLSTSPGVVLRPADGDSMNLKLAGGGTILFEGKPYVLDHIAICVQGVWDKEGDPSGVLVQTRSDSIMSDETKEQKEARESKEREDKARRDAVIRKDGESDDEYRERQDAAVRRDTEPNQMLETLDAFRKDVMSAMDGFRRDFGTRLDKVESKWDSVRRDEETPEQKLAREAAEVKEREDKARRDAAEVEREKARADSAVAALGDLQARLAALETRTPLSPEHADYTVMAGFQARADRTYSMHGLSAPRAMEGETPLSYRRRLVSALKRHSPDYKEINIGEINSEAMLAIVEKRVYEDADKAAKNPIDIGVGELRKVVRTDDVGRRITEFHGDPRAWMDRFRMPYRMVTGINRDLGSRATH